MASELKVDLVEFRGRTLPSENEIMAGWIGDYDQPAVSVVCNTFNHEMYIEDAIRGFLIQKTDFPFEIIIHDDASTDNNRKIIREYEKKYPKIIKPIIQKVNQYSQGKKPTILSFQYAKGEYIALCEGDDFWIFPGKLQSQFDLLNSEAQLDGCAHPAFCLSPSGQIRIINDYNSSILSCSTVCKTGGGVVPTASLFLRRKVVARFANLFSDAPLGDYFIQVLAAERGGLAFQSSVSSVYRLGSVTSVSNAEKRKSSSQMEKFTLSFEKCLDRLNEELGGNYIESLAYFKASMYKEASVRALVYAGNQELFRKLIERSSFEFVSRSHFLIFKIRRWPWLISWAYQVREVFRKSI